MSSIARTVARTAALIVVSATCSGGEQGATGPAGPQGATGPAGTSGLPGSPGPTGLAGISGLEVVSVTQHVLNTTGAITTLRVDCPVGKRVLAGGFSYTPPDWRDPAMGVEQNYPSSSTSWTVAFKSGWVFDLDITVYATCANAG
jgi:Collagen triple helix repeat (20 copies)